MHKNIHTVEHFEEKKYRTTNKKSWIITSNIHLIDNYLTY